MTARQDHGFVNEKKVCKRDGFIPWKEFTELNPNFKEKCGDYISTWDAIDPNVKTTGKYGFLPVQIKTIKEGAAIELGSLARNSKKNETFRLIVEFYEPGNKAKIIKTHSILVDPKRWRKQFRFSNYNEWCNWIKNKVSNLHSYDETWRRECKDRKSEWHAELPNSLVSPRFKRDHKKQRRIQCAIPSGDFHKFIESVRVK